MYDLESLYKAIGYRFNKESHIKLALTHSSYANEKELGNLAYNERLEFLGDSVLGLVISDYLYQHYSELPEGELTKVRALIVCEATLAKIAKHLSLGMYMNFGKGEVLTGGRERVSILADAMEALIAAIYLDGGLDESRKFILKFFDNTIKDALKGKIFLDYKSALQEHIQSTTQQKIEYRIVDQKGPDHAKIFYANVLLDERLVGEGEGRNKKEAEQAAARQAIEKLL